MLENIIMGLISVLNPYTVIAIAFGLCVGLLFGAIPGISGIMAISILLPLTFYVSPLVGIPMLLGIYKAGIYGGSITAVLLNTPGNLYGNERFSHGQARSGGQSAECGSGRLRLRRYVQ